MRPFVAPVLALLLASPSAGAKGKRDPSTEAYESARHSYYVLKDDAQRRKYRHNWLKVAGKFEAVARKYPKSARAADALYTSAELLSDLSRISMLEEDLKAAIQDYEQVVQKYPKSSVADDAALALARIHLDRTGDTEAARRILEHALNVLPKGDARPKLLALRGTLPTQPEPRATGKRIAARGDSNEKSKREEKSAASPKKASPVVAETPKKTTAPVEPVTASASPSTAPSDALAQNLSNAFARVAQERNDASPRETPAQQVEPEPTRDADGAKLAGADLPAPPPGKEPTAAHKVDLSGVNAKEAKARLKAAVRSGGDEFTLAEQLGLKVRRVVIDAGHGGHDTGAIGKNGTREKDVTLAIARRVGEMLADRGLEVILTRDDDTFVRLEERTRIANEAKGDLFISIHCNAAESRKVRGIETFTLNVASDRYSIRLAARENASSEKSISDLQFILADLATKANTEESQRLATRVQKGLVSGLRSEYPGIQDLGTKQALFYVLLGAKMPAILIETSFISHPEEEKRLASKEYQEDVARAIADGVQGFLEDRERLARVD